MSWLFSQVLVEAYSEENSLDGEQFAQLSVMPTQHKFWRNDKTMEFSKLSQFGLTCAVLKESHGEELLTWYLADFLARTSARQEKGQESKVKDRPCGDRWHELSVKFDLGTQSWKTHQCLFPEVLPWSLVTLPSSGMMQNGCVYQLKNVAQIMSGKEFGFLLATPTATANQASPAMMKHRGCREFVKMIPTPTVRNSIGSDCPSERRRNTPNLASQIGGKIPPNLTEWMMGWPQDWTDLKQLGTDKFQSSWLRHFKG